jgi:membrane protein insertase Oxa1/YidC/SpoIIIJ
VYWTSSNVLTMIQQVAIMRYLAKKKAAQAEAVPVATVAQSRKDGKTAPRKRRRR